MKEVTSCFTSSTADSSSLQIPNLTHVFLIGFFDEKEFTVYISSMADELRVPVRYRASPSED